MERSLSPTLPSGEGDKAEPYKTANPLNYDLLKENAKQMRKDPTQAETAMWNLLHSPEINAHFRRQHVIGDYIVDFVDLQLQLIIEVDGEYHNDPEQRELDKVRANYLTNQGFSIIRFTNEEVLHKPENVCSVIKNAIQYLPLEGGIRGAFVSGDKIQSV
ncbi:MAG: endonuclease domain-containing protein, partial [Muribaculaceae bacterium]|nr:endonuclease domain-containing protein [Muribaculaceae bacterium]